MSAVLSLDQGLSNELGWGGWLLVLISVRGRGIFRTQWLDVITSLLFFGPFLSGSSPQESSRPPAFGMDSQTQKLGRAALRPTEGGEKWGGWRGTQDPLDQLCRRCWVIQHWLDNLLWPYIAVKIATRGKRGKQNNDVWKTFQQVNVKIVKLTDFQTQTQWFHDLKLFKPN